MNTQRRISMYKNRYDMTITDQDFQKAQSSFNRGDYALNYIDPLRFKVVEQYLSHCPGSSYDLKEILEESNLRRIIDMDEYLKMLREPEKLIPESFDAFCEFIGSAQ